MRNYGGFIAAPQIVGPLRDGVQKFVSTISSNSGLMTLLMVIGGIVIAVCIALLLLRKFWPQTPIGRQMNEGNSSVVWCIVAILLGTVLILPGQILPFLTAIIASLVQWVILNPLSMIFGI
ncbi:hypothetical protein [Bombiscardovia coagulans]|uniref:Uncharacterized protein n=1 Tax=Bombiscardovia coagulans TaxID=686666 RepID=A0A261ET58_9BIFI|nr:hypothetical protein [Bombiscardovia coagulans]OZG49846.1 hypothetical protein BOCO_0363 [Bombiscardovia coagulans]